MSKKLDLNSVVPSSRRLNPNYKRVHPPIEGASLTQQEYKDQCDINHQIALFRRAGRPLPAYGKEVSLDYVQDVNATYLDAINAVREVEESFQLLPAVVRSRFDNDPVKLARFLSDDANREEAYSLGLVLTPPPARNPLAGKTPEEPEAPKAKPPQGAE